MSQGFGNESPRRHSQTTHSKPTRYLVVIDSGGFGIARLFLDDFTQVAEFDAGAAEVTWMTADLSPTRGAGGHDWDHALEGHSAAERAAAEVYRLDV